MNIGSIQPMTAARRAEDPSHVGPSDTGEQEPGEAGSDRARNCMPSSRSGVVVYIPAAMSRVR